MHIGPQGCGACSFTVDEGGDAPDSVFDFGSVATHLHWIAFSRLTHSR